MSNGLLVAPSAPAAEDECAELLDGDAALARLGGNARLLAEAATLFLEDYPAWLAEMGRDLRRGNARGLYFTAHLLRGALSHFGSPAVCNPARELEIHAHAGDLATAAYALAVLKTALSRLTPALAALAAGGPAA